MKQETRFELEKERMRASGEKCALKQLTMTARRIVSLWDAALKPSGLTGNQFNLLANLAVLGDSNISQLARFLDMDATTLSRTIKPLNKSGYLKVRAGIDARHKILSLSKKGEEKFCEAAPLWAAIQENFLEALGPEKWDASILGLKNIRGKAKAIRAANFEEQPLAA